MFCKSCYWLSFPSENVKTLLISASGERTTANKTPRGLKIAICRFINKLAHASAWISLCFSHLTFGYMTHVNERGGGETQQEYFDRSHGAELHCLNCFIFLTGLSTAPVQIHLYRSMW